MKKASLGLVLVFAITGCGDNIHDGDDDGAGSGSSQPEPGLDATGTYRIHSTFDIATNMPGGAGTFVNSLIAATDEPSDPMKWVLDELLAQMPSSSFKSVLQAAEPFVAGYLNDRLNDLAPELTSTIVTLGQHVADMTKHFGVNEKLVVSTADQAYIASITADGVRFTIDGNIDDLKFADHDIDDVYVDNVLVTMAAGPKMQIGDHALPLPYGKIVRMGLDAAIIPVLDPSAHDLADLLDHLVNCAAVGQNISTSLGVGNAAFWGAACHAGMQGAASFVYEQIAAQDSLLTFQLTGNARVSDSNDDRKIDKLEFGTWSGMLSYGATDTTLAQPATFDGARM